MRKSLEDKIEMKLAEMDIEEGQKNGNKLQEASGKLKIIGIFFSQLGSLIMIIGFIVCLLMLLVG